MIFAVLFLILFSGPVLSEDACEGGTYIRQIIDNHYFVDSEADCFTFCDDKLKCKFWAYRANRRHCKLFGPSAIPLNRPFWSRGTHEPCIRCMANDACNAMVDKTFCSPGPYTNTFTGGDTCSTSSPCTSGCCDVNCETAANNPTLLCTVAGWECSAGSASSECDCICFAASSMVYRKSDTSIERERIRIDELRIGDEVLTFDVSGQLVYSEVYYEPHAFPFTESEDIVKLIRIQYDGGFVDISGNHLMYATSSRLPPNFDNCITYQSKEICVHLAESISSGDVIWRTDPDSKSEHIPKVVTQTSTVYDTIRAPKTLNGNIVVNDILCSAEADHHSGEHATLLILRLFYFISPALLESEFMSVIWEHEYSPIERLRKVPFRLAKISSMYKEHIELFVYSFYGAVLIGVFGMFVKTFQHWNRRGK